MKKAVKILFVCLLLAMGLCLTAGAETIEDLYNEQLEASGGEELLRDLPAETRELLDKLGIDSLEMDSLSSLKPQSVWSQMLALFSSQAGSPIRACGVILGIILLCAWMDGLKETVRNSSSEVFGVICALAACGTVIVPIVSCIRNVSEAAGSASIFMTSYVPVYAGVLLTSGQAATAVSYQSVVLFAAELISLLATQVVVPLMTISLALGVTGSVSPGMKLDAAGTLLSKAATWLLGLSCTLFVGLLSLQSLTGAAVDTLGGRAVKFTLSSFVPVVGNSLGEAFSTIKSCLHLLKSTLGGFGILATALIVLPPLLECVAWTLGLSLCVMASEMFGLTTLTTLLKAAQSVVKTLIGVLASCAMFLIVSTAIVTMSMPAG